LMRFNACKQSKEQAAAAAPPREHSWQHLNSTEQHTQHGTQGGSRTAWCASSFCTTSTTNDKLHETSRDWLLRPVALLRPPSTADSSPTSNPCHGYAVQVLCSFCSCKAHLLAVWAVLCVLAEPVQAVPPAHQRGQVLQPLWQQRHVGTKLGQPAAPRSNTCRYLRHNTAQAFKTTAARFRTSVTLVESMWCDWWVQKQPLKDSCLLVYALKRGHQRRHTLSTYTSTAGRQLAATGCTLHQHST
jgi:hypothetical protein